MKLHCRAGVCVLRLPSNMEEKNEEQSAENIPLVTPKTRERSKIKLLIYFVCIFIVVLVVSFFILKEYFPKQTNLLNNHKTVSVVKRAQEVTPKPGYFSYKDTSAAIRFQYPKTLSIIDTKRNGEKMLPKIFFQTYQYPKGYTRNYPSCPVNCISFSAFFSPGNATPYYDIPLQVERNNPKFPIYDYPQYIYKDETGSRPFKINGMKAVVYYSVGLTESYVNARVSDNTIPVEYILEERVFINDPNLKGRVIYILYQQHTNKLPGNADSLSATIIKGLFNKQNYKEFQDILASVKTLPVDTNQFIVQKPKELGISFKSPKYWGYLKPPFEDFLSFNSLFFNSSFSLNDPVQIEFKLNSPSAPHYRDGFSYLYQYSGQPLDSACKKSAYLSQSPEFDIKIQKCNTRILKSGMKVVVFKGVISYTINTDGETTIPVNERKFNPFEGAIFPVKIQKGINNNLKQGMTIHFDGTNANFISREKLFNKIVNSLSYLK